MTDSSGIRSQIDINTLSFEDLFDISELQKLQNEFSEATGIASIITKPDGTPITAPSRFANLCDLFCSTAKGKENCLFYNPEIAQSTENGPIIHHSPGQGLYDASIHMTVQGIHMANWMIGQVRDTTMTEESLSQYARAIGLDPQQAIKAVQFVPKMSKEHFVAIAHYLYSYVKYISNHAYQNYQLTHQLASLAHAKNMLRQSETRYEALFEHIGTATLLIEEDMTVSMVNRECETLLGRPRNLIIGRKYTEFLPKDQSSAVEAKLMRRLLHPGSNDDKIMTRIVNRQGECRDCMLDVCILPGTKVMIVTLEDFTELNRLNRALNGISAVNKTLIHADDETNLIQNVCRKIVKIGGYRMAWVGYLENDEAQSLRPVASAGFENGYLQNLNINLTDPKLGSGPGGTALKTGRTVVCKNTLTDPTFSPWRRAALERGYMSLITIPLQNKGGMPWGVLSIYSAETGIFDKAEKLLLCEMAGDLAYGISALRIRTERDKSIQELEKSLDKMQRLFSQIVTSLGSMMEIRDPYTSGHQKNVAALAVAIARKMNLTDDQIEGISVAGQLHDIGKISVPSEILNKPGKLSDAEFALIKSHPQAGYDVVKSIETPWPVADIILQHHERIDGSGYPHGLHGDQILLEARIMAVADVVEAIAAYRPYRPSLGIDAALGEIQRHRGTFYDSDVVDACLKLFWEDGYQID